MASPLICLSVLCLRTVALANAFVWTTAKVSPVQTTWQQGLHSPECRLLGRELVNEKLEDIRVRGVASREGLYNEYWVGAHVQYTKWIRLTGCYQTSARDITFNPSNLSVKECYNFCRETSFGLSSKGCVCLNAHIIARTSKYCMASPCPANAEDFCGSDGIPSFRICLCIYDIIDLPSDNKIGNCKAMMFARGARQPSLVTTNCSEEHRFLCKRSSRFSLDTKATNWSEAGFGCHRERRQFYNGQDLERSKNFRERYWVSVFRKQMVRWGNNTPQGTEFDCLAASVSRDGTLNPFVRKCYIRLPLMCDEPEETQSTVDNNVSIPANKEAVQLPNAVEPEKISVFSLLIGVVCGILVTLMALMISVIIYRLRKRSVAAQASQNRQQEVALPETLGVHYEHLRPEHREGNIYDVCGHSSVSYDYIPTQERNDQCLK